MNINLVPVPDQNFSVTPTAQPPTYITSQDLGQSAQGNQSITAPVSQTSIDTSGVNPQAPVMTSTQTPQQLAQNPIDAVASFLMSPDSESVQSALAEQGPIASVLQKIMALLQNVWIK